MGRSNAIRWKKKSQIETKQTGLADLNHSDLLNHDLNQIIFLKKSIDFKQYFCFRLKIFYYFIIVVQNKHIK